MRESSSGEEAFRIAWIADCEKDTVLDSFQNNLDGITCGYNRLGLSKMFRWAADCSDFLGMVIYVDKAPMDKQEVGVGTKE